MYQQLKSKLFWFGAVTVLATILWIVFFFLSAQEIEQGANQAALLKEIKQRTKVIALASSSVMKDQASLEALQTAHQDNVEAFQALLNGNIKTGMSALKSLRDNPEQLPAHFDQFSHHVSQLLQKRTAVERLVQDRDAYIQGLDLLVDKAKGIVLGVEAAKPTQEQLNAAFAVLATLQQSQVKLTKSYYTKGTLAPLPVSSLRKNLALLSTDEAAPTQGPIRRSAANLLSSIEEHQSKLDSVDEHNRLKVGINELVEQLSLSQQTLEGVINGTLDGVRGGGYIWFYLTLAFGVLSIGLAVVAGQQLAKSSLNPQGASGNTRTNPASADGDQTSQTERARFKTEKNRLINDIRPLANGVLYIKADENLESTGEIARYFNQSREAIAYRIESLRQHAHRLQRQVSDYKPKASGSDVKVNIDTSSVEELTFRANAELDGLQRRLKALHYSDKEEIKALIVRCIRAERMLDEIRIRVKKGWLEDLELENQSESIDDHSQNHNEQIKALIGEMLLHLNEFKLQAPRPKQGKKTGKREATQGYQTPKLKTHTPVPSDS